MPIRGEIAEIIDKYTVILNVGRSASVTKGMKFVVYAEGERIIDKSGNDLGVLEIPKAELKVTDVQERLSIAETTAVREIPSFLSSPIPDSYRVPEPLRVDEKEIKSPKVDMTIVKGDKVRQVF
jgi:LysM repeat protein